MKNKTKNLHPDSILSGVDDATYKKLRWQILITTFLSYAIFYISRKHFGAAAVTLRKSIEEGGVGMTDVQYGGIVTAFGITYGLSKFASGLLSDNVKPRKMIGPALIIIGLLNFVAANMTSPIMIGGVYILTALFQGSGFPPIAKSMSYWYSKNERGMWYSFWNASHNVGGALAPLIAGGAVAYFGDWSYAFYIPGAIAIVMGILALIFMRNKPEEYGLPPVGEWKVDAAEMKQYNNSEKGLRFFTMIKEYILKNPTVWVGIFGITCVYVIRAIINEWVPIYYSDVHKWGQFESNSINAWFEACAIIGGIGAGFVSDLVFKSNRWTSCLFFSFLLLGSVMLMPLLGGNYLVVSVIFGLIGVGIYSLQLLFALGLIETTHKDAAGSVTGFKGLATYLLPSMIAGSGVAYMKESFGWNAIYFIIVGASLILILSLIYLVIKTRNGKFG